MTLTGKIKKRLGLASVLLAVLALGYFFYAGWIARSVLPEGLIAANGRIEGDEVVVAGKFPGRVAELLAREGDWVEPNQLLARLDDAQVHAQVRQAKETVVAAEAQAQMARNSAEQARRDTERFRGLSAEGTASAHEAEKAELAWKVARDQLAAAQAQLNRARAASAEVESVLADLTIRAPVRGVVTARLTEPGEVMRAGAPLLILVNLDELYLKAYVPEVQVGKLRLGLPARIYTDAFPDRPFTAELRYIAAHAEFTPKEVHMPDERVKLVYAVKLYLKENPERRLTPGLPADAVIRWRENVEWAWPSR